MFELNIPALILGFIIGFGLGMAFYYYTKKTNKIKVKCIREVANSAANNPMMFHHEETTEFIPSLKEEIDIPNDKMEVKEMIAEILPVHLSKNMVKELASGAKSIKETIDASTNYMLSVLEQNKEEYDVSCCYDLKDKELYDMIFREIESYIKRENITAIIAKSLAIADNQHRSKFERGVVEMPEKYKTLTTDVINQYYTE